MATHEAELNNIKRQTLNEIEDAVTGLKRQAYKNVL